MPNDTICGNCNSERTVQYFPECCLNANELPKLLQALEIAVQVLERVLEDAHPNSDWNTKAARTALTRIEEILEEESAI